MPYLLPVTFEEWYHNADVDFDTNAPSYYSSLGKNKEFLRLFTQKMIEINNGLIKDFADFRVDMNEDFIDFKTATGETIQQFNNRLDNIKQEMIVFFNQWLADGVLDEVINQDILNRTIKYNVPKNYGAVGDGITDDTVAIQACLDDGGLVFFDTGSYYFKKLYLRTSNTRILFGANVTLKSDDKSDSLQSGAFNIEGSTGEVVGINQTVNIGAKSFGVTDTQFFAVGDLIQIIQDRPSVVTDIVTHKQMYSYSLVTVKSIDTATNTIHLFESVEHLFAIQFNPKAVKVNPVENIELIGLNTKFDKMGTTEYSSHFYVNYGRNIDIKGFEMFNGGGKAVSMYNTYLFNVDKIKHHSATNTVAGHGYNIFINRSSYGLVENIESHESRHAVDISTSSYKITVRHCYGERSPFTSHGSNSQFFTFEDCHGEIVVGNYSFMTDNDVKIINCSSNGNTYGLSVSSGVYNVDIDNFTSKDNVTGLTLLGGGDNINISNFRSENDQNGMDIRNKNANIISVFIKNPKTYAIVLNSCQDIRLGFVSIINEKETQATTGIRFVGTTHDITVTELYMRGKFSRAILFMDDVHTISLNQSDILCECIRLIEDGRDINKPLRLVLSDSKRLENTLVDALTILSANSHITLKNNANVNSPVILNGTNHLTLIGNEFNKQIGIVNGTSKILATGNYGDGSFTNAPVSNGTSIIIVNNLNPLVIS